VSYIQSEEHFKNYLIKAMRNSPEQEMDLLPWAFYVDNIYKIGLTDQFTWALREKGISLLSQLLPVETGSLSLTSSDAAVIDRGGVDL